MSAAIVARSETSFTIQVEIPYGSSMLDFEQVVQERLNQAGIVATQEALRQFDTDGSPITVGSVKFTSKGRLPKEYQIPYGVATVASHTSTRVLRAARPTALSTGTPASSSVPPPGSPR